MEAVRIDVGDVIPNDLFPREFDSRSSDWLITKSWFLGGMLAAYILTCRFLRRAMAPRAPFDLKYPMIVYNLALVLLSAWMFSEYVRGSWHEKFSYICQPVNSGNEELDYTLVAVTWWYYLSKFIEFFDTFFMLLRKKTGQVSFLHLYHHTSIAVMTWYPTVFCPGGHSFFAPMLNSLVHTFMYAYYLLTALGVPARFLWWKKYITKMQLTQFGLILIHCALGFFGGCGFPRHYVLLLFTYNVSMVWLFANFYTKAYDTSSRKLHGTIKQS